MSAGDASARRGVAESELFSYLEAHDAAGALDFATALVADGVPLDRVVDMLARAQRIVGERWQRNEWTVAQEHAATAITDRVLAAVAASVTEPAIHPRVLVVCAEGEWHTLAPRMLTDLLRARRWDAHFLGGSIPARHLASHLDVERPLALAVSCSIPMFLPGAYATIAAAREVGVPTVAGGRGFGTTPRRAETLGASAWAPDARAVDAVLVEWAEHSAPPPGQPDQRAVAAHRALRDQRSTIVQRAEAELFDRLPYLRQAASEQLVRTREDLEYLAAFVEAAVLTDDTSILAEYFPWLAEVLVSRQVPPSVLHPTSEAFIAALERHGEHEAAARVAAAATAIPHDPRPDTQG